MANAISSQLKETARKMPVKNPFVGMNIASHEPLR